MKITYAVLVQFAGLLWPVFGSPLFENNDTKVGKWPPAGQAQKYGILKSGIYTGLVNRAFYGAAEWMPVKKFAPALQSSTGAIIIFTGS